MFRIICSLLVSCSATLADDGCADAEILAGDGQSRALLGGSVALSEDTLLVGAWGDDDLGRSAGAAYLYSLEGSEWVETQKLHAADGMAGDAFGYRVSLEGDVALIGAPNHDHFGDFDRSGAAYVFRRQGSTWVQEAELHPSEVAVVSFGSSLSLSGNVALVGASADSQRGEQAGATYVFRYVDGTWTQEAKLFSEDIKPGDQFGLSVSISGNLAVIGAPFDDEHGRDATGAAFVFRFDDGRWIQVAKLLPDRGKLYEQFGRVTAISGETVFVSANTMRLNGGVVIAFGPVGPKWRELQELTPRHRDPQNSLGSSLAATGDTLLVGSPGHGPSRRGGALLFRFDGLGWHEEVSLWPADGEIEDRFGSAVAVWGDMGLVGAPNHDDFGSNSGAAYLFDLNCPRECNRFRRPLCDGDVSGDGVVDDHDAGLVQVFLGNTWEHNVCKYDLDCDGEVSPVDVGIVMALAGTCEPPRPACLQD